MWPGDTYYWAGARNDIRESLKIDMYYDLLQCPHAPFFHCKHPQGSACCISGDVNARDSREAVPLSLVTSQFSEVPIKYLNCPFLPLCGILSLRCEGRKTARAGGGTIPVRGYGDEDNRDGLTTSSHGISPPAQSTQPAQGGSVKRPDCSAGYIRHSPPSQQTTARLSVSSISAVHNGSGSMPHTYKGCCLKAGFFLFPGRDNNE